MIWNCIAVGCGGALGSVCRYLLGFLPVPHEGFPFVTLGVNILGAFLIGLVIAFAGKHGGADPRWILFLQVGFCGGFTTFSTFSLESYTLIKAGQKGTAVLYIALSVGLCLLGIWLGHLAARRVFPLS